MKQLRIVIVCSLFALLPAIGQAQTGPEIFSLNECIEFAFQNSLGVKNAGLDMESAEAKVGETMSDGLPQINGAIDYSNYFKIPNQFLPTIIFDPTAPEDSFTPVPFAQKYNASASINLSQMVFDGSYFVGLKAARTFRQLSTKDHVKTKVDVVEMVTKAYYAVLVSEEGLDLANNTFNRLDSLLRETTIMYENGFAEKIDVNRITVQFNNIQVQQSRATELLRLSYLLLKYQMGMPLSQPLKLQETIEDVRWQLEEYNLEKFDYSKRIEFSQLETSRDLALLDLKNNQVQYLPSLDFIASVGSITATNEGDQLTDFNDRWFGSGLFGFTFNLPIFDGLRKSHIIQQNRTQLAQIDNQFVDLKNAIDLEIQRASSNLEIGIQNLKVQEENMLLADEVFRVTKIKYQEGIGSNLELVEADSDFKEAETNYFNALYDALIAKVELEKALGTLLDNHTTP